MYDGGWCRTLEYVLKNKVTDVLEFLSTERSSCTGRKILGSKSRGFWSRT
jgi:hypothetical protein